MKDKKIVTLGKIEIDTESRMIHERPKADYKGRLSRNRIPGEIERGMRGGTG